MMRGLFICTPATLAPPSPGAASRQEQYPMVRRFMYRQRLRFALARTRASNLHVIST
jgi:hypothetical protein